MVLPPVLSILQLRRVLASLVDLENGAPPFVAKTQHEIVSLGAFLPGLILHYQKYQLQHLVAKTQHEIVSLGAFLPGLILHHQRYQLQHLVAKTQHEIVSLGAFLPSRGDQIKICQQPQLQYQE